MSPAYRSGVANPITPPECSRRFYRMNPVAAGGSNGRFFTDRSPPLCASGSPLLWVARTSIAAAPRSFGLCNPRRGAKNGEAGREVRIMLGHY